MEQTNRRTPLGAIGLAPVGANVPAVVVVPLDPHSVWLAEWHRLHAWCNGPEPGDRDIEELPEWQRMSDLEDLIADTPAVTRAGLAAQAEIAMAVIANDRDDEMFAGQIEVRALRNIAAALGSAQGRA